MNIKSPLIFGNRQDSVNDIFKLALKDKQDQRYAVYYDLAANSGEFFLAALAHNIADFYIINDHNLSITLFWKAISEQPQVLIDTYTSLVRRYSSKNDIATRSKFYQDNLRLFNRRVAHDSDEVTPTENAIRAGNFAFLINHASSCRLPLSEKESLHCESPTQMELPEIDSIFQKTVQEVHALLQQHAAKINFECKPLGNYLELVTPQDLVMIKFDQPILELLVALEDKDAAFIAVGNFIEGAQKTQFGHMVRANPRQPEQLEHVYVASQLVRSSFRSQLIRYDLVAGAIAQKNPKEASAIVQDTVKEYSEWNKPLPILFEERVKKIPHKNALVWRVKDKYYSCTFEQLNCKINQLAANLLAKGVSKGQLVVILVDEIQDFIKSMMAVLKIGAIYMPISASEEKAVTAETLSHAQPSWLLAQTKYHEVLKGWQQALPSVQASFHSDDPGLEELSLDNPITTQSISPDDLAYIMNTSGSTGRPKGATNFHRGLPYVIKAHVDMLQITQEDRIAQMAKPGFDASLAEISLLTAGATLYIAPAVIRDDNVALAQFLQTNQISVSILVPSKLKALAAQSPPSDYPHLRAMIITGEKFDEALVNPWLELPNGKQRIIVDGYGPTECTIGVTLEQYLGKGLTIGRPIIGTTGYLVNVVEGKAWPGPVPPEYIIPQTSLQEGELYIAGASVGQGYWRDKERTKQSFVTLIDPDSGIELRAYRTGDLCQWVQNEAGKLSIIGRIDNQIKLRGQRIDPEHIEFHLKNYQENGQKVIDEAYVVAPEEDGNLHLAAYLKVFPQRVKNPEVMLFQLRAYVQKQLPHFMVPNAFQILETIPTINDKVSRKALKAIRPIPFLRTIYPDPPANEQEEALAKIWSKVINRDWRSIKRYDDFFCLGGSSILISGLLSEVRQLPQIFPRAAKLKTEDVYRCSLLKSLTRRAVGSSVKKLAKGDKSGPVIVLVHSLLGDGWSEYEQLVNSLKTLQQPVYALQAPALSQAESYDKDIEELAQEYLLALQLEERIHRETPVMLVCSSSSGLIGALIAKELIAQHYHPHLILMDCLVPDLNLGQHEAEEKLLSILNEKLDYEVRRSIFNQRQYDFALWLFREELRFFAKQDALGALPEKTVLLATQHSPEKLILGHSQIKEVHRFNTDHFGIVQLPECINSILDYCRAVTKEFRAIQQRRALPDTQRYLMHPGLLQAVLLGMPPSEGQDELLYSNIPMTFIELEESEWLNTNNLYSVFFAKLRELIINDRLPENEIFDKICCGYLQCSETNRAALKDWLLNHDHKSSELVLQSFLREIAISLIERHYPSVYQKIYEDRLYDNYMRSRINIDPEFYISRILLEKFKSEQNMAKEDLINWWRASGKAIYFEELRRTLNKFVTKNYWTCQIEIDALLSFFKVELKYVQEVTEPIEPLKTRAEETAKLALPVKKDPPVIPKPFRALDTGEAYQPTRLIFEIVDIIKLITTLNNLKCCSKTSSMSWNLYWRDELDDIQFQSVDDYQRPNEPIILAKISINTTDLQLNTLSIKRLALLAPFFYEVFCNQEALVRKAYYYTLLFCYTDEIPSNLWPQISLNEADEAFGQREKSNSEIEKKIKNAASKEESDEILSDYVESESAKDPLPIEVFRFKDFSFCPPHPSNDEGKAKFLAFYIYVRAREELAIKRWIEPTKSHTLSDVAHRVKDQFLDQGDNERQSLLLKLLEETRVLEQEVDQDSANVVSWQQLGCLYQEQGNLERSLQCFQTVLTLLPQNSLALQQLALVYAQQKNYEDAERNYRDSLALESNFGNHFDLAILLYKQEKYEVALDHFLRALLHDNGGSWVLKQKNEEEFLKQLFGQAFHTHTPLIKDRQFVLYLGLVLCFNKMQALHLRDFYILRLVSLVTEHKGEAFYRDILEDFTKLIDFKNDVISVQHWFLIDIDEEESSSRDSNRYSWSRLKRLVSYYPSSVSYHILAKISGFLKKIEEHDEFLAIAMSLEGEQKATDPKYQQPSTIAKLLASSIARALQESKVDRPLKEQRLLDSTYHYQAEDIRNLLAVVGSKQAINVLGVQYIVAELKQDKEKLAVNFKIEMDKALRNDNPSIMAVSLSKSDDVNQHWIGMLIKPEAGNPLKPTIYIIDSLGSGFELDFDISRKTLFDLIAYKSKSPQLWEGIVVIMGFLNGFEKLRPNINVTGLKQQSDVNDTGPCTVQNLLDMAGGKKLQSYSKHAVKNLRAVHAKMLTEKVAPSLTC